MQQIPQEYIEPRDSIPLLPEVTAMLASERHRLHHMAWHAVRDEWLGLGADKQDRIRALGWQPGHRTERPSLDGPAPITDNGSGEDFLFMHRQMIAMVRGMYDDPAEDPTAGWANGIARPGSPAAEGYAVPPNWYDADVQFMRRLGALKSDGYYWSAMRGWERQYRNGAFLSTISLGALGSMLEFTVHNDMHMRWASEPRDPVTNKPAPPRDPLDFGEKWLLGQYDFLGETFSSHVNPVFWRLHGWVDARIDDWFAAHDRASKGSVAEAELGGVAWFAPGEWVSEEEPWAQPKGSGHGGGHDHHSGPGHGGHGNDLDPAAMKDVLAIIYGPDEIALLAAGAAAPGAAERARPTWFLS